MNSKLEVFCYKSDFMAPEERIRRNYKDRIGVFYAFNNYNCSVVHINELAKAIKLIHPQIKEEEMEVEVVTHSQSIRHVGFTTLCVPISVDEFLKLRRNMEIGIL